MGFWRRYNSMCSWKAVTYQYLVKPTSTSTLCKADTYQYLLQSRYLLVPFAKPTPTSTHCKAIIYQYPMVRDDSFSIVWGADFIIVQGAVFSIVRGAIFSIVQGDIFSIVRGDAFVKILHRLLGFQRWSCSTNRSEVLGEAWGWWRLCGELNSWLCGIAQMRLCTVSGYQVRWPGYYSI